ncbi:hypothetical protein HYS91_01145 [Candidatus Daviesbacteria bacterium]|nr:hypothetical protein [Candidatus Daviesbacteria bacterium]
MSALEIALVILISIWSLIFVIIAIALLVFLRQVKLALDRINKILENAEDVAEGVGAPLKMAAAGVAGLLSRFKIPSLKRVIDHSKDKK